MVGLAHKHRAESFRALADLELVQALHVEREWPFGTLDLPAERVLLASSTGGWVNLEAVTIANDVLIVGLVWRSEPEELRDSPVSVNYGGLMNDELERLALAAKLPR
jgi:hypothetical protein